MQARRVYEHVSQRQGLLWLSVSEVAVHSFCHKGYSMCLMKARRGGAPECSETWIGSGGHKASHHR